MDESCSGPDNCLEAMVKSMKITVTWFWLQFRENSTVFRGALAPLHLIAEISEWAEAILPFIRAESQGR
jgi:hypothetical protein